MYSASSPTGWTTEGSVQLGEAALQAETTRRLQTPDPVKAATLGPNASCLHPVLTTFMLEPPSNSLSLEQETQRSKAYHGLRKKMIENDMFVPPKFLAGYGSDIARYTLMGSIAAYFYFKCASLSLSLLIFIVVN